MLHTLESWFVTFTSYGILLMEFTGVIILLYTAVRCLVGLFKHKYPVRLKLAQGIALALEFKLGGEVLRTAIVRDWTELVTLGAIVLLRIVMTILIHWEIQTEEKHMKEAEREMLEAAEQMEKAEQAVNASAEGLADIARDKL